MAIKKEMVTRKKPGPKPKEKDTTNKTYRHIGIPTSIYNDMEDENLIEKRAKGERVNTEETIIGLISEGIKHRKALRDQAKK